MSTPLTPGLPALNNVQCVEKSLCALTFYPEEGGSGTGGGKEVWVLSDLGPGSRGSQQTPVLRERERPSLASRRSLAGDHRVRASASALLARNDPQRPATTFATLPARTPTPLHPTSVSIYLPYARLRAVVSSH